MKTEKMGLSCFQSLWKIYIYSSWQIYKVLENCIGKVSVAKKEKEIPNVPEKIRQKNVIDKTNYYSTENDFS